MPLSYTWHLPTFFLSRQKTCESQSSSATSNQIGLIEHFLALVGNTLGIRSVYDWYTVPLSFGIRLGIRWYFFWYTFMFSFDSLVYGRYTVGIRSVYGWYTVFFLFKPFFAILLFAKPNFGDCLIPKIKSYSGCSASRCAEELNFMMVSNDCESSLHNFPFSQLHFATKLIAECARQISPENNGHCSLPQRNAKF